MAEESTTVRETIERGRQEIESGFEQARTSFDDLDKRLKRIARERPLFAVAVAVAAGFVFGRILSRI